MNKILILQSNYIPWKGYFDLIETSDIFVIYDDMQYTKGDWRNRNMIKTDKGLKWLTIPVEKTSLSQKINETKVVQNKWNNSHWETLKQNYKHAKNFVDVKDFVEDLYANATQEYLTDVNIYFMDHLCRFLDIDFNIKSSKEFYLVENRTQRLVDICTQLNGNEYISGPAAKAYMEENIFNEAGINLHYFDYSGYPEYSQLYPPFEHGVTILDLIFNEGTNAKNFLKTKSLQK
ncbi:WbqC family protein [Chryseobacterium sp. MMS23-Vi53]|uniref:WbqC family protein n=1 Tax=Chryseobacterium sp. MMS23-Vi53 TaxID=3386644 RepID=UPI0039ED5D48